MAPPPSVTAGARKAMDMECSVSLLLAVQDKITVSPLATEQRPAR